MHLEARVVVLHGDEEGHAEAKAVDEVQSGVGERPVLAGMFGPCRTRPVFARELEAELVEQVAREREIEVPLTAFEWSFSIALALRPQESTSKVPLSCFELV